ncbi:MAG: hypothetical protein KatS3mg060_1729 [Dehalococcoidia bacterium]|nr:MAG: hypothetical protein KatS3mg060_1729 [Dehalococcoidia bacterium]
MLPARPEAARINRIWDRRDSGRWHIELVGQHRGRVMRAGDDGVGERGDQPLETEHPVVPTPSAGEPAVVDHLAGEAALEVKNEGDAQRTCDERPD